MVDKKIIPVQTRTSKYKNVIDKAKTLKDTEALQIQEGEGISLLAIMSLMRKANYKVTLRTENKIKTLYVSKAEPKTKKV